ncbi:hypothetical protein PG985_001442 [Apiospora marii]|uniref:Uncharacterized protein n=1 Tax=Apiospora marii TaxID=335849 RepID=A0ABR1RHZ2_9PEZI
MIAHFTSESSCDRLPPHRPDGTNIDLGLGQPVFINAMLGTPNQARVTMPPNTQELTTCRPGSWASSCTVLPSPSNANQWSKVMTGGDSSRGCRCPSPAARASALFFRRETATSCQASDNGVSSVASNLSEAKTRHAGGAAVTVLEWAPPRSGEWGSLYL